MKNGFIKTSVDPLRPNPNPEEYSPYREQLHGGEDGGDTGVDQEDGRDVLVQHPLHHEQAAVDVDLLHDHADVGDLEDVLAAARGLEQAARIGD